MKKTTGVIKIVSRTGGVMLKDSGTWINPTIGVKDELIKKSRSLLNRECELVLNEKNLIASYKVFDTARPSDSTKRDIRTSDQLMRGQALECAIGYFNCVPDKNKVIVKDVADKFYTYIKTGE